MTPHEQLHAAYPQVPLWVTKVFPAYFTPGNIPSPSKRRKLSTPQTEMCVTFSDPLVSSTFMSTATVNLDVDPCTLVTYHIDQGHIQADFLRPFSITTPGMVTCFPKLTPELAVPGYEDPGIGPPCPPEIDLTLKGAQALQHEFKAFMDRLDDKLLDFVCDNQTVLGKTGLNRTQVEMMMKQQFRPCVSIKTGKSYPDALTCRYKSKDHPLQVVDTDLNPIDLHQNPNAIGYNDIIRVGMRYNGSYVRGGHFGNSWEMLCVQHLGHTDNAPTCEAAEFFQGPKLDEDMWPTLN